jgi:hypothetical protein
MKLYRSDAGNMRYFIARDERREINKVTFLCPREQGQYRKIYLDLFNTRQIYEALKPYLQSQRCR